MRRAEERREGRSRGFCASSSTLGRQARLVQAGRALRSRTAGPSRAALAAASAAERQEERVRLRRGDERRRARTSPSSSSSATMSYRGRSPLARSQPIQCNRDVVTSFSAAFESVIPRAALPLLALENLVPLALLSPSSKEYCTFSSFRSSFSTSTPRESNGSCSRAGRRTSGARRGSRRTGPCSRATSSRRGATGSCARQGEGGGQRVVGRGRGGGGAGQERGGAGRRGPTHRYAPSHRMVTTLLPFPSLTASCLAATTLRAVLAPTYRPSRSRRWYTMRIVSPSGTVKAPSRRLMSCARLSVTRPWPMPG